MLTSADPLRHVAGTSRRNNSPCVKRLILWKSLSLRQNFVAAISRTNRGDKISESSVVAPCVHFRQQVAATKYKWTNERTSYGQPCWIRKLVHIPLYTRLLRVHRTDVVSQRLVLQLIHTEQLVAETCRLVCPGLKRHLCLLPGLLKH